MDEAYGRAYWVDAPGDTDRVIQWLNQLTPAFLEWELNAAQRWCFEWLSTIREHAQVDGEGLLYKIQMT